MENQLIESYLTKDGEEIYRFKDADNVIIRGDAEMEFLIEKCRRLYSNG
jgi:hypothetical protein